jgi:hypothetical protein
VCSTEFSLSLDLPIWVRLVMHVFDVLLVVSVGEIVDECSEQFSAILDIASASATRLYWEWRSSLILHTCFIRFLFSVAI